MKKWLALQKKRDKVSQILPNKVLLTHLESCILEKLSTAFGT
jgi:hypothetical protein